MADIAVTGIFGRVGIGVSLLCFSIEFRIPTTALPSVTVRAVQVRVDAIVDSESQPTYLGLAEPEVPFEFSIRPGEDRRHLLFTLPLAEGQLFALEKIRAGREFRFALRIEALADGQQGIWPQHDEVQKHVNLSEWAKILNEIQGSEYLVVGLAMPRCERDHVLAAAVDRIRSARESLVVGRYDAVVSECRMAIESAILASGERAAVSSSIESSKSSKREMTKLQREFALVEAVRHYTHLAHHTDRQGRPEYYSRDDANMLLAMAASLVASCVARVSATITATEASAEA